MQELVAGCAHFSALRPPQLPLGCVLLMIWDLIATFLSSPDLTCAHYWLAATHQMLKGGSTAKSEENKKTQADDLQTNTPPHTFSGSQSDDTLIFRKISHSIPSMLWLLYNYLTHF